MKRLWAGVFLLLLLVPSAPVLAGETGSISGLVTDPHGAALPGITVKVSGDLLPGGRTAVTGSLGRFLFPRLLPGEYKVEVEQTGLGKAARSVRVQVDVDAQANLALNPALSEELTVTAEAPVVDLRSTEVNFNYTARQIETLPVERSYRGLFALIPGVADNRSVVGPSGGGSRQDNTYLIDGVNITNPGFGYLSTEVNELDIAEFNVKRGAITAEFGRSAGIVTNAVSRSGTNDLRGSLRFEWLPQGLISKFEDSAFRDPLLGTVLNPAIGLGGPLVKDRVFWYASARYFKETKGDRLNQAGEVLADEERTGHEVYGKLTATPGPRHLFALSLRDRPSDVENASLGAGTAPTRGTTDDNGSRVATASWSFFPGDRTLFDVKYLYLEEKNESVPDTALGYLPLPFNGASPALVGQYTDPARANLVTGGFEYSQRVNYKRHEIKLSAGHFLDIGGTGHQVKVGGGYEFGEEDFFRRANGWGQISRITVSGQPVLRARYYFEQPPQLGQGRTWSIFAQDTVSVGQRLTLNLGVLLNRDEFAQDLAGSGGCPSTYTPAGAGVFESDGDRCTFVRFGFGDEVQPRLGFNYNLRAGKGDKLYGNFGRYYNMDQKSSGRSLAPRRIFQREARFTTAGVLISDLPRASTTGKLIAPDLEPTYNDEFLLGYATPLVGAWSLDLFYQYRRTRNFIEDVPSTLPDTGPYAAANLPCDSFAACRGVEGKRTYSAATLELARRFQDRWGLNLSYTYSQLEGNFDLDYSGGAVFNTSSFIQDGPGTNVDEPYRFGRLREDRPHVVKLFVNYQPLDHLTLGGYLRVQSGTTWTARGPDTQGGNLNYLEPAGSNRNPTWTNFDLRAAYGVKLGERANLTIEGRLLNVFDAQTRISTDSLRFLDLNRIATAPFIGPYRTPNPFFGAANAYAPPRRLVLSARLDF